MIPVCEMGVPILIIFKQNAFHWLIRVLIYEHVLQLLRSGDSLFTLHILNLQCSIFGE